MPIAMTEEQRAVCESIRDWARETTGTGTAAVRALEEPSARPVGPWQDDPAMGPRWRELAEIGVFAIALDEEFGGAGGSVPDLAAAVEQTATELLPGPVTSTALAGVVLSAHSEIPLVKDLLREIAEGATTVAVCTDSAGLRAEPRDDGGYRVTGETEPVPDAGSVSWLLLPARCGDRGDAWFLVRTDEPTVELRPRSPLDFSRSVATIRFDEHTVDTEHAITGENTARVSDLAATLRTAEVTGVASWCLETAAEYARAREQFGRAIGSFQAVQHLCAGMLCRVEQSAALAWDAARAAGEQPDELPVAAATATAVIPDAAVQTAQDCVQVLGGTGFTWEHDAHLYLRRALAVRSLLGGGAPWRRRTADRVLAGSRRSLAAATTSRVGTQGEEAEQWRPRIRADLDAIAADPDRQRERLADSGYLAPHWPRPYGLDASPALQLVIDEELSAVGLERPELVVGGWAVPTILQHGTDEQREHFVRSTLRGEVIWCQLFSEPGAGSDLAGLRTRAERGEGGWWLSGQKVWTSVAREADWAICLARTDPEAPKHRGITYFLVDMRSAGVQVRPLREITGDAVFNEVFLDDVFVPDDRVVGEVDSGWRLARTTLANERVAMSGGSALGEGVERLLRLAEKHDRAADPVVRDRLGAHVAEGTAVSLLGVRSTLRRLAGEQPGAESSVAKLLGVWHRQAVAEYRTELLGPLAATVDDDAAEHNHELLLSRCLSIAGGTTQVLLGIAAERILGLPRAN